MVRVITQETYDEVVKENMEEFSMTPQEAIQEAIAQFEAQGVNLANIIKDLALSSGDSKHLVSDAVTKLKELGVEGSDDQLLEQLEILKKECHKDLAYRMRAGKEGAYKILVDLLEAKYKIYIQDKKEKDRALLVAVLDCLVALMDTQPDLLDAKGAELIKNILDNVNNSEIIISTLKWITQCLIKHEMNKQNLFAKNLGENFKVILQTTKNPRVISECLQAVRKFTLDDDVRVEFGRAHEHSRDMGVILLEPMTKLLKEHTKPPLVSELMLTIASLLVRHELCKKVADCGVDILFTVLADNYDNVASVQQANKLITALAGNDDVKRDLVNSGIVPIIIALLSRHAASSSASQYGLKCVAALTLREQAHSKQFLESGVAEAIVECMKLHPDSANVQKHACWAIRNMVARCRTHNQQFKDLGIEALLNQSLDKFGDDFGFDIKSALRDLDCEVKLEEQWTGKGVQLQQ